MRTDLAAIILVFCVQATGARGLPAEDQLPPWAHSSWSSLAKKESVEISTRLNPFVWRGDFDGDGRLDLAILVRHTASKKEGLALLLRMGGAAPLMGAGKPFGNGGDDFSWIDLWYVEDRGTHQRSSGEKSVRHTADSLIVVKEGSASARIYLRSGKTKWQQQGD